MRTARTSTRAKLVTGAVVVVLALVGLAACGGEREGTLPVDPSRRTPPTADVAELEIRGVGVDRFVRCPPPGALGQHWIPPLPAWSPPASASASASSAAAPKPAPPPSPDDTTPPAPPVEEAYVARTRDRTATEMAVDATHRDFRSCYRRGLVHDPTQDGRVAIVLRVGPDGRVAQVESYAACELAPESLACMKAAAARLRFPPPPSGHDTITIPAFFTSRDGISKTVATDNDAYTAASYVTLETARPALHACEETARRELRPVQATATYTLTLAGDGKVTHVHIDPWTGDQPLLVCGAAALEKLAFSPPPGGKGTIIARINFNPRQGTR